MRLKNIASLSRRRFLRYSACAGAGVAISANPLFAGEDATPQEKLVIMTVRGPIRPRDLGCTLSHEHVLVDFIGADKINRDRYDEDQAFRTILPHLQQVKALGCQGFVECTPSFLGKNPALLVRLAKSTGLHILTNTGYYGASENKFLPSYAWTESAAQLAQRWLAEWTNGIEGTGVRPGFIKIGVGGESLSDMHQKLVKAAALTHRQSGLVIASHTGPAKLALEELEILRAEGVGGDAFIWVHAQLEPQAQKCLEVAESGCWVSFDGFNSSETDRYVERIRTFHQAGRLGQVLISHDAGWFKPGEPGGGSYRGYTEIFTVLLPALWQAGIERSLTDKLLQANPARAFAVHSELPG
jgi:phosphotriesterase-related protein